MGRPIKKGSTNQSTVIRIIDSTNGTPETGVEHNSAGIDLWWRREQETKTAIVEAALAALNSAHSDGGIEHIADGYYRLDLPDAAVAAGAGENSVQIGGTVTGMIVIGNEHALVDYDPYDSVRAGLTALPNAAANAAGGLPISAGGALALDTLLGRITGNVALASGVDVTKIHGSALTESAAGRLAAAFVKLFDVVAPLLVASDVMVGTDNANTTVPDAAGTAPTAAEIKTAMEAEGASDLDAIADAIANGTYGLSALRTRGDAAWTTGAGGDATAVNQATILGYLDTEIAAILAAVDTEVAAIKAVTDVLFGLRTTISSVQTADTVFDLTDGIPNIDDYNNMVAAIKDVSSGYWVVRRVTDYDEVNKRVTIDRNTGFPLAAGDFVYWSNLSYTPAVAAGGGATAQEVHEYDVTPITTPGQAGYEIQQGGGHLSG